MIAFGAAALAIVAIAIVEIVLPGRQPYHTGWLNVAVAAFTIAVIASSRRQYANAPNARARAAVIAVAFGAGVSGLAVVAGGLFAPDNRIVVGTPGQHVRVDELGGSLNFPLAQAGSDASPQPVILERPGHAPLALNATGRDAGSFVLRTQNRPVVYVEARDARGARLTVTQPSGIAFLSPVLLMQQRQTIAGLNLPFDSFAVPAAHRVVRAVLFSAQEAATLRGMEGVAVPAVLFAVDDENDRAVPGGIALAPDGATVRAGGLQLRGVVLDYPAVESMSAPPAAAAIAGAVLAIAGLFVFFLNVPRAAAGGTS